jgi:cysteine synthase
MPASTSGTKVALIESQGGRCHFVESSSDLYAEAERVAKQTGGHRRNQRHDRPLHPLSATCHRLCVVDPENSAFYPAYAECRYDIVVAASSRIEGIGRPRVEPSFLPEVVDRMVSVPDAASIAAARHASAVLNRRVGASTGTNLRELSACSRK